MLRCIFINVHGRGLRLLGKIQGRGCVSWLACKIGAWGRGAPNLAARLWTQVTLAPPSLQALPLSMPFL